MQLTTAVQKKAQQRMSSYLPRKITANVSKKINGELLKLFYLDFQPFSVVDDRGFRQFVKSLNPCYELPNRQTISRSLIPALYENCLTNTKNTVSKISHCCLTTDCWTSSNNDSFISVTVHFLDENFKIQSMLLTCSIFDKSHTSENLAKELLTIAKDWAIEGKIVLAVSDNAANIKSAIQNRTPWKFFGCYAHTLNLIVGDALKLVDNLIGNVKTIVSHFKRSATATSKLMNFQINAGCRTPRKLLQDVVTRWNSTYYMLQRFVDLEDAVRSTVAMLNVSLPQLSPSDWECLKELCKILKPFENATTVISGENYMSASLVIVLTGGLLDVSDNLLKHDFSQISRNVIERLQKGISDRLQNVEYSNTLAVCTFLDPRFKLCVFKNKDAAEKVRNFVTSEITKVIANSSTKDDEERVMVSQEPSSNETTCSDSEFSIWNSLDKVYAKSAPSINPRARAIMEVQRYVEDELLNRKNDPLEWWNKSSHLYPHLSKLVITFCCCLGTSVPCERIFSKGGNILSDRRTRLSSNKVKQLLFLNVNAKYADK
jgi:hypothetical protein